MKEDKLNNEKLLNHLNKIEEQEQFLVPENYFNTLSESIIERKNSAEADEEFFMQQEDSILFKVKMSAQKHDEELSVPSGYFEKSEQQILTGIKTKSETKIFTLRKIAVAMASAACIAAAVFYILPQGQKQSTFSLETVLAESALEENDYLSMLSNDELNNVFISDLKSINYDDIELYEEETSSNNENFSDEIKPSSKENTLTFEDITEEEMLQYLEEENSDELYNY